MLKLLLAEVVILMLWVSSVAFGEEPYRYLQPVGDGSKILTAGYLPANYPVPQGYEMIQGQPPAEAVQEIPLAEALREIFSNQPLAVRANFYLIRAAVKEALEAGDPVAAKLMIEAASVPEDLEPVRVQMLQVFEEKGL